MKFSEAWLKQWTQLSLDTGRICEQLTMAGLEVDSVSAAAHRIDAVVAAKIVHVRDHEKSAQLKVCELDIGAGRKARIVSGARNVLLGACYPYAPPGSLLGERRIEAKKIKGVLSEGMLCSAMDLGMEESSDELLMLDDDSEPGGSVAQMLQLDDHIIEVDLTPNRGDCLSLRGMARELALNNGQLMQELPIIPVAAVTKRTIPIHIENKAACPRYVGRIIEGVNPRAKTPSWMLERLRRSGIRGLGCLVDITNYVLIELGQPMHAFDLSCIKQGIVVRDAEAGEKLVLLNGQTVDLQAGSLVIADQAKPLALAGIMGGSESAVSENTADILLESAFFAPTHIAGRARRYGLHTDSSHRFERYVDSELQATAVERATALILEISGGRPGPLLHQVHEEGLPQREPITLRQQRLQALLGVTMDRAAVEDMLTRLGARHGWKESDQAWSVTVPSHRGDLTLEVDLIEEVARIYGYGEIPQDMPCGQLELPARTEAEEDSKRIADTLIARGYHEAITYSFLDQGFQELFDAEEAIRLKNPLSEEMAVMRTSLWPGLVKSCLHNLRRQQARVRLFEMGLIYRREGAEIVQNPHVAGLATGPLVSQAWQEDWKRNSEFFHIKSDFMSLLGLTGRAREFIFKNKQHKALHPGQSAIVELETGAESRHRESENNPGRPPGREVGWIGTLNPEIARQLEIEQPVVLFDLDLAVFKACRIPQFKAVTKFPIVRRDLSFLVKEVVPAQDLVSAIRQIAGKTLENIRVFDLYQGEGIPKGEKSISFALNLQHGERTLKDEEVADVIENITSYLSDQFNATLRV